jgi:tetratricopeptide (TPR) repeat protein
MKFRLRGFLIPILIFTIILPLCTAAEIDQTGNPWYWYNKGVDLANEGKYQEALRATDNALAINESFPLAQTSKAGILVQLGRYDEAVIAADKALASNEWLPNTFAAAYFNKGDALRHLGRTDEARAAFAKAQELDPSLIPPDMSVTVTPSAPVPTKSPLSCLVALAGFAGACWIHFRSRSR